MKRTAVMLALILVLALNCPALLLAQTGATATPDHVHLTWTGDPATTMTINWRTDATTRSGVVQYAKGTTISPTSPRVAATSRPFSTDLGTVTIHVAKLTKLSPNTQYSYRVGNGSGDWSPTCTFTTAETNPSKVKFLVFGDSQSPPGGDAPYGVWKTTLHNAFKANPDARFFMNCGDLVDVGNNYAHWNGWFSAAAGVADRIPICPSSATTKQPLPRLRDGRIIGSPSSRCHRTVRMV